MRIAGALLLGLLLIGGGVAIGRWVVPTSSTIHGSASSNTTAMTTSTTTTTIPGTPLPIQAQTTNDGISPSATILAPSSCVVRGSTVTATGGYSGEVGEFYLRVGGVVELYVYTAPASGYPAGFQVGLLSMETPAQVGSTRGGNWRTTVPIDVTIGTPVRCEVTVQATHQVELSGNAY